MPSIQPQLNSSSIQLNENLTSTKFQLNLNPNLILNLPSIQPQAQIKHSNAIYLMLMRCEKFKNFTFVVNLASGFQTEVAVVYIFKFVKHLTKYSD